MFQDTIKNVSISFDERNTFSAGDFITSAISFDLTKEIKISGLTLKIKGGANVHWSTASRSGNRRRGNYRSSSITKALSCKPTRLLTGQQNSLQARMFIRFHASFHRGFLQHLCHCDDFLQTPLSGSNFKTLCCLWCASGPITMTVSLERKAFKPGETTKVMCIFCNASSRTVTPNVKLQQKQTYYTHYWTNWTKVVKQLARITGNPISAHTSDVQTEMMLPIPSYAPPTISNCIILEVEYIIEVNLCLRGSPDLTVVFPIVLCEVPAY